MYEDLVSLVVELARRYTRNSSILDKHANPLLTIAAAEEDIEDQGARHDPTASSFTEKVDAARLDTEQQRQDGFLFLTGTKQRVEYATWDGDLGSSMEQIDRIKQELHLLTGLLNFLQAPDAPMSGVALRLMNIPLYASTKAILRNVQNRATDALRALQTIQGTAPTATVVWEHPFDVLEGSAEGGMVDEDGDPEETEDEEAEGEDALEDASSNA